MENSSLIILCKPKKFSPYQIIIEPDVFFNIPQYLDPNRKYAIISDSNVLELYANKLNSLLLSAGINSFTLSFPYGEKNKNLITFSQLQEQLELKLDRNSCIIALGGGVTGDLAGFVASTYMRGISFIQMPTSLLSMVDSSVGGKLGVNTNFGKNTVGLFNHPEKVIIDPHLLNTLSQEFFTDGMAEIIKTAILAGETFFSFLEENSKQIYKKDQTVLTHIIRKTVEFKISIVEQDENETNLRKILNLGHTFAHVIENISGYDKISHGKAVAIGINFVCFLSNKLGYLSGQISKRIQALLSLYQLPKTLSDENLKIDPEKIYRGFQYDKKNFSNKIVIILIQDIGKPKIQTDIDKQTILEAISHVI